MSTFILIWAGELISLIGSGMTSFALGVWIYQQTGEATPFALTMLFYSLPRLLLFPVAGMLADRWDRRWLMILADSGSALTTLAAAILVATGRLEVFTVYLLVALNAAFSAFQEPAYRASVTMLIPKNDLARASGMMSASDAGGLLISPLLAGFLFGVIGLPGIILIDFATFFFALGALLIARIPQPRPVGGETGKKASLFQDTSFAWRYLRARPGLFWLMWYAAWVNFFINLSSALIGPLVLAISNTNVYGLIQMVMGVGMLAGSVVMSVWGGPKRQAAGLIGFIMLSGVGIAVAGLRPSPWLIGTGLFLFLFFIPFAQSCSTAISQAKIEPSIQGRIFSIRGVVGQSMMPIAYLSAGPLADRVFGPLLSPGGGLAAGPVGQWMGVGPGRGMGLIYVISGLLLMVTSLVAWVYPRIRWIEDELPDCQIEPLTGVQDTV